MSDRRLSGTEDTIIAGLDSEPGARSSGSDSMKLPKSMLVAERYELLGLVGVGGMGSVYRARDVELDEVVALKVLRRELVDAPGMLERFRREVKLARRVTHRNVARTFDIGEHAGERFLTMEFIEGESLGILLEREGTMPLGRALEIISAVCEGLGAAHAANVVHRDLKPDNVLIGSDGRIAITDFGVARIAQDATSPTQTLGVPVGTPAYMSPEQVEGAQDIDARTDIYAVGAILYELLTGEMAWGGVSPYSVAAARLLTPAPDPRVKKADLPEEAARIVLTCMARAREDRFSTAEELSAAIGVLGLRIDSSAARVRPIRRMSSVPPPREALKAVAVLPFTNRGEAPDEYLGDGLTEDLIDALAAAKGLLVRPRGAVMTLKGEVTDPREAGRALDVQVVVDGSVRRVKGMLRVSARLVSVADGFQLWAQRYERPEREFFAIADEAAAAIAEVLTVERSAMARESPPDTGALDLYLRARHAYHSGFADTNIKQAIDLFAQALERAPNDPRILAGHALALMRKLWIDEEPAIAHQAYRAAERARAVAPNAGEPLVALASYHFITGDAQAAAREANDALRRAPLLADVHDLCGRMLIEVGRPEEGIAMLDRALSFEPSQFRARFDAARTAAMLGDWTRADALLAMAPDGNDTMPYWYALSRLAMWKGDVAWVERTRAKLAMATFEMKTAIEAVHMVIATRRLPEPLVMALEQMGKVTGRVRRRPIFFRQLQAELLAYSGQGGAALETLEDAAGLGLVDVVWLDRCPLFEDLRGDRRFGAIRARVAARAAKVLDAFT